MTSVHITRRASNWWTGYRRARRLFGAGSFTLVAVIGALLSGCREEGVVPTVDCQMVTAARYGELSMWPLCVGCHAETKTGGARNDAPGGVNYDSFASAKVHAVSGAAQVNAGLMPPGGSPQPSADQKTALYNWALCGTPE